MSTFPTAPATNLAEATSLIIDTGNRNYNILIGDINTVVETVNGDVPSIRKAIHEMAVYKSPLAWSNGTTQTDLLQPRSFNGHLYVPTTTPALMGVAPAEPLWALWKAAYVSIQWDDGVATEGQTSVTFSGMTYIPGGNNLSFYVNGSLVSPSNYTESSDTTIVLDTGMEAGDEWFATVNARAVSSDVFLSSNVTYTKLDGTTVNLDGFLHDVEAGIDVTSGLRTWSGTTDGTAYLEILGANTDQASAYIVHIGSVYQSPETAYTINTTSERVELLGTPPATGIPWVVVGVGYGVGVGNEAVLDSFNAALNTDLSSVDYCRTLSYYSGDGKGGARFHKTGNTGTASTYNLSAGVFYDLVGNQFVMLDDSTLTTYAFGAKNYSTDPSFDNSVCNQAMLNCFGYCRRPAGTFRYKTPITIKTDQSDFCEQGDSFGGHRAIYDEATFQIVLVGNNGLKSTAHTRIHISGYKFTLYAQQMSASTRYVIDADNGYMDEFEDITFGDGGYGYSNGITCNNGNLFSFLRCRFLRSTGNTMGSAVRAVRADGYGNAGSLKFTHCQFERGYGVSSYITGSTLYFKNVQGISIDETNHFEVSGIYLYGVSGSKITSNWFQSSLLIEDIRSYDNEINVSGKDSRAACLGWSKVGASIRGLADQTPFYDWRVGTKTGSRITTAFNTAYGATKTFRYGETDQDVFFAINVRGKSEGSLSNVQIRIKDDADTVIKSSPTFTLVGNSSYSDVTGADNTRPSYTWMHVERVAGSYLWVDVVDATSGTTLSSVECVVFASKCVNRNARFLEGGGSNSGWTTASATATTPLCTLSGLTSVAYSSGQLVVTPSTTGGYSMSQQLLLEPGKTYMMIAKGSCVSGDEPGIKVEQYHNATTANNYINNEFTYNNNSDTESWLYNASASEFVVMQSVRQIDNDSTTFVSVGNLSGHSGAAVYFDWIAVFDITPYDQKQTTYETEMTFTANDTSPSVGGSSYWVTANSSATTISQFDGMVNGQEKWVRVNDANTTLDFTGTIMKGNNGSDYACGSGDMINVKMIAGNQYCTIIQA